MIAPYFFLGFLITFLISFVIFFYCLIRETQLDEKLAIMEARSSDGKINYNDDNIMALCLKCSRYQRIAKILGPILIISILGVSISASFFPEYPKKKEQSVEYKQGYADGFKDGQKESK